MTDKKFIDRLNKRIVIQEKSNTSDGFGGYEESWSDLKTLWAEIKPISNFDDFEANQIGERISYIITIRYYDSLTTQHRIKYGDRIFNIIGIINPLENNQTMQIEAEEIL
ncbi:MAG TPA: phage head closure protein [Rickettsiales bacterium]|nr:phage head closure protein [Rickettsiales bacterium]